jgi:hypothetical protein
METIEKKQQEFDPETMFITLTGEVKRLSKAGIWRRKNPKGILVVNDRRAVNR